MLVEHLIECFCSFDGSSMKKFQVPLLDSVISLQLANQQFRIRDAGEMSGSMMGGCFDAGNQCTIFSLVVGCAANALGVLSDNATKIIHNKIADCSQPWIAPRCAVRIKPQRFQHSRSTRRV